MKSVHFPFKQGLDSHSSISATEITHIMVIIILIKPSVNTIYRTNIPILQIDPSQPEWHEQLYPSIKSWHTPLMHGEDWHSSSS